MALKPTHVLAALIGVVLSGCTRSVSVAPAPQANCVPVPEGVYEFRDGKFYPESVIAEYTEQAESIEAAVGELEAAFVTLGYSWLSLQTVDGAVFLTGTAPDISSKEKGFAAAAALLKTNPVVQSQSRVMVDRITVSSGDDDPIETSLEEDDTDNALKACTDRLNAVLDARLIRFVRDGASLTSQGAATLDEVTAIARDCETLNIHITVRASQSSTGASLVFPAVRAESVRRHLERGGISSGRLSVLNESELQEALQRRGDDEPHSRPVEIFFVEE